MFPLEKIPGINAALASLLAAEGIHEVTDLARADARLLGRGLARQGQQQGLAAQVPEFMALKLFINTAQEMDAPAGPKANLADIPEAQVDRSHEDIPEAIIEPINVILPAILNPAQPALAPTAAMAPRQEAPSFGGAQKPVESARKGIEPSRFQTIDDYAEGGRGIQPLKRTHGSRESAPAKLSATKGQALPRTARRGVMYPWPFKAVFGALIALLWRLGLLVTCIALPYYSFVAGDSEARPIGGSAAWMIGLLILNLLHLWFISHARCRVCSCHLFFSKRCFKNTRAHLIPGLGYVISLALHLLIFQWFRCMYCGTAIRLFGSSSSSSKSAPVKAPAPEQDSATG